MKFSIVHLKVSDMKLFFLTYIGICMYFCMLLFFSNTVHPHYNNFRSGIVVKTLAVLAKSLQGYGSKESAA